MTRVGAPTAWHASGFSSWDMSRRTGLVMIVALAALIVYPPPAQVGVRDTQTARSGREGSSGRPSRR